MTQSQQSFTSDTGAALEQAMALLEQKGLIIQKYMQKMGYQQSKIEQLVEEIQRLNWENRQREYNQQLIRKVSLKDLIQQGFVEIIQIGGNDQRNKEQGYKKQSFSSSSSRSIQVKGSNSNNKGRQQQYQQYSPTNSYQQPKRLYVIRVMVDEQSEEILLTNNMHLLKDNYKNVHSQPLIITNKNIFIDNKNNPNYLINNNKQQKLINDIGLKTNVNTNDQQSQQLIESYCQSVLRQVQEMKQKLLSQSQYTNEKVIKLKEENLQLKQSIINMEKSIMQLKQTHRYEIEKGIIQIKQTHKQEMLMKQNMINQIVKQSQAKLQELKQTATKTQAYLMQQLKLRVSQINDVNQHFANEKSKYQKQLEEKDNQLQQKVNQMQQKDILIKQLNQRLKDITTINEQQLTQMNKQIQQKTTQISTLQQQIQHLKSSIIRIKQHQTQLQKQHSIILQKEKSSTYQKNKKNILQKCCQTDPQLVLDIDFLRKTKLDITRRREEMREIKLSPENGKYNMSYGNNNNEYSSYKVIQQTHKDAQGIQYKICLPPSLDMIAFDFQRSVSSSANISPQRKFSNHNIVNNNKSKQQQSFYSNQKRIQEMYTIPKQRHNHMKHYQQIRYNNSHVSHMQTQRNKYMSQPTIPLEFSHSNSNDKGVDGNQQNRRQQYSSSQQSDRIRVTPQSDMGMMLVDQSDKAQNNMKKQKKQQHTQQKPHRKRHQQQQPPFIKQLHGMKPKVASYSQKNIIIQEMNQDDQHHQLIGVQQNQLQKIHKHSSHDHYDKQQHKINYVNVTHHYHNNNHHAQQKQTHLKIHHTSTLNDIDVLTEGKEHHHQQHPNLTNLQQRRSDELIPSRSALTESSASSIREISPPQCHEIQDQKLFDMNYFDDDAIIDENLQNSDHPSETYKNSLRFPNGYCSGSMDKIPHKQHNDYHQSNQLSKSIGYDLHRDINRKRHPFITQYKNAKQLLQLKSPQIVMKSLIDKSFPIQKNPFKLSNEFINVAELLQQQKKDTTQNIVNNNNNANNYSRTKVDYLTVNKINKSSNPGSDSLINIMIDSNEQHHDHVQLSRSNNHDTTKQRQSQYKIVQNVKNQGNKNYPINTNTMTSKVSNFKTPKKHKTIQLAESLDFQSLKKIQTENVSQKVQQIQQQLQQKQEKQLNTNTNTKSKKKQKIIYFRR